MDKFTVYLGLILFLIYIIGIGLYPDIFFDKTCYKRNPITGNRTQINCSLIEHKNYSYQDYENAYLDNISVINLSIIL